MNNTILISFASNSCKEQYKTLIPWAMPLFKQLILLGEEDLTKTWFYSYMIEKYGASFFNTRGFGYWSWKPYIILNALETYKCPIFYCDANIETRKNAQIGEIYNPKADFFYSKYKSFYNKQFIHRDCFIEMGCDDVPYWFAKQAWAAMLGFNGANPKVINFVKEWAFYCQQESCVADQYKTKNICTHNKTNFPDFVEHRHDQSILSILLEKYKIPESTDVDTVYMQYLFKDK